MLESGVNSNMLFPGSAFKLQIKFFGAPAQFLQHREKVFCFKKILEEILREDVSLRSKNIQKESLELFYKSQEKSQSKQILCLAHFLQHLKIQKGSNISQQQSNKTPKKNLFVATQGKMSLRIQPFPKWKPSLFSKKSRKFSDSQKNQQNLSNSGELLWFCTFLATLSKFKEGSNRSQTTRQEKKAFCFKKILWNILIGEGVCLESKQIKKESLSLFSKSQEKLVTKYA